ncbi:MAG: creatininase family protein [Gemmatimonadota bacterium]|jgi:creatinine amidohydrolase
MNDEERPKRLLDEMTWTEVEQALEEGRTTVVVAVGATEQHGPHLPLRVDATRGDWLAVAVAERLGDHALVAPTIRVGCSEHHMSFAGTISLRRSTLEALCMDYCVSLARHGFRRICLVPSHGGNFGPLRDMLDDLNRAVAPDCSVQAYTNLEGFLKVWVKAVQEVVGMGDRVGGHADIAESSEMLVLRPDLVRKGKAEPGYMKGVDPDLFVRIFRDGLRTVTPNGILGDSRGMSAAIGKRCLERSADALASAFTE